MNCSVCPVCGASRNAAVVTAWIAYWVILFTGTYPAGMFDFVVGTLRWSTRLSAWLFTLTDEYPPFTLA